MKVLNSFFTLLRHEMRRMPVVLGGFLPVAIAMYWCGVEIEKGYGRSGFSMLAGEDFIMFFSVIAGGLMVLNTADPEAHLTQNNHLEFMFSRAVDRKVYFRAKWAAYLAVVLSVQIIIFGISFSSPDLILRSRPVGADRHDPKLVEWQREFAGSRIERETRDDPRERITIPNGRVLYAGWKIWGALLFAAVIQWMCTVLEGTRPRTSRVRRFWSPIFVCLLFVFAMMTGDTLFLAYRGQPWLGIVMIFAAVILIQKYCERKFSELEIE